MSSHRLFRFAARHQFWLALNHSKCIDRQDALQTPSYRFFQATILCGGIRRCALVNKLAELALGMSASFWRFFVLKNVSCCRATSLQVRFYLQLTTHLSRAFSKQIQIPAAKSTFSFRLSRKRFVGWFLGRYRANDVQPLPLVETVR